jgi:hypothetical protein
MDEETKFKFEDFERRLAGLDKRFDDQLKRFDDVKWLVGATVGGTSAIFTVIFATLTLISGWNYNSERQGLRDFQKEIREQVTKTDDTRLGLYALNLADLSGQDVEASLERITTEASSNTSGQPFLRFAFIVRNEGESNSGPLYIKLYTKEGLKLNITSSDDQHYAYEGSLTPDILTPSSIPGKMSMTYDINWPLPLPVSIAQGKHAVLLKVYYGRGKVASAPLSLVTNAIAVSQ